MGMMQYLYIVGKKKPVKNLGLATGLKDSVIVYIVLMNTKK